MALMGGIFAEQFGPDAGTMAPMNATKDAFVDFYETVGRSKLTTGYARRKFSYMKADYVNPESYVPEGYYGISCGETVNLNPAYGMWRPSWAPRIAPAEECNPDLARYPK